jgi:Ca2+/Na+ antiporter
VGAMAGSTIVVSTVALGACLYISSKARGLKPFTLQISVSDPTSQNYKNKPNLTRSFLKVKKQCFILVGSVIVPMMTILFGFSIFVAWLGILLYCGFLYYSLQAAPAQQNDKKEDVDLEGKQRNSRNQIF